MSLIDLIGNQGIIAVPLSIIATILSVLSFHLSKRQIYAHIVATNRFIWIAELRKNYSDFINTYCNIELSKEQKINLLLQKKFNIELYFNNQYDEYKKISSELQECIDRCQNDKYDIPENLLIAIQATFTNTHTRAKRESGITKSMEEKMREEILGKTR